ncbi:unnamed protein product [Adineta steineri]|uniref:Uncharacterized protein n=1 Tax=Adineta steineri TaxID=433720 RepID=A0A813NP10_9BILA|nr:unnamed protein product [Adineta steineri]
MTSFVSNNTIWQLNDEYSVRIKYHTNNHELIIELFHNGIKTNSISLNNDQCSTFTRRFCDTTSELNELLTDLLMQTSTDDCSIRVIDDGKSLEIIFPIYFGSQNRKKIWSFSIHFPIVSLNLEENQNEEEISLDPLDWTDTRIFGHKIMDDMIDYLRDIRQRPTWRPMPTEIKSELMQSELPLKGESPWKVYEQIQKTILPYPIGNIHPRFWGYVRGNGSSIGALAEFITATMNTMSSGGHQSSIYVERQILSWLKIIMGFPNDDTCSGALVSGTSVATIISMAVAKKKFDGQLMKVYYSSETHTCLMRAAQLLGIENENMIMIPTNDQRQIDLKILSESIDSNSCAFIVGSAGTVGTGSIDDLQGLANLCSLNPNKLWFHVDGAIGAVARCSTRLRSLFIGLERADSIAFDLHKWLFIPYECGCVLIRHGELHRATFAQPHAFYLALMDGGITPREGEFFFSDYTLELSRNMKSLKVWMTLKTYGIDKIGQIMEQNVDQAKYFVNLIEKYHHDELQVLANVSLNIVCFRYYFNHHQNNNNNNKTNLELLNKLNKRLLVLIQERGIAVVSPYVIDNEIFAMRMCIINHRTKQSDLHWFIEKLLEIARQLRQLPEFSTIES